MHEKKIKKTKISLFRIYLVKLIIFLGQKTIIGRGQLRKKIINFINYYIGYGDIKETRFICNVNGIPFNFYNDKLTRIKIYFGRNERKEIEFIKKNSLNDSVFIDIGSNMGLYSQTIAFLNHKYKNIKIISIDAHPLNNYRLKKNLELIRSKIPNIFSIVKIKNCALGDKNCKLNLDFSGGLANGVLTNKNTKNSIRIECKKLIEIVREEKLNFISNLKIDVEGYEDRILINYFNNCKKNLYPKNIILEHSCKNLWKEDLLKFLYKIGYVQIFKNKSNMILNYKL